MARRDHGRSSEAPLEPDRQVHEGNEERQEDGSDRTATKLTAHARTHGFGPDRLEAVRSEFLLQHLLDPHRDALGAIRLRGYCCRVLRADGEVSIRAKLLDLGALDSGLIERCANLTDVWRVDELELHKGSARELDAVVGRFDRQRSEAENDEGDGDSRHHLPPADEIVVGVVQNSKH